MTDNKKSKSARHKSRPKKKPHKFFPISGSLQKAINHSLDAAPFTVFDIETTGGNPERNGITEIYAVKFQNGELKDSFYSLVNPGIPIPPIVRKMTGINNKMLKGEPKIRDVMPGFVDFIGDDILVSHNTIGDMKFLRHFADKVCNNHLQNFFMCTHLLVEKLVSESPDKSLKGLAHFLEIPNDDALHRAKADAIITVELFKHLLTRLKNANINRVIDGIRFQADLESGMRLGWAIPKSKLQLPHEPGVLELFDIHQKKIFSTSMINLNRETQKLLRYDQLPKPLLKRVLQSYDLGFQTESTPLSASLKEANLSHSEGLFNPNLWHLRYNVVFNFEQTSNNKFLLSVSSISQQTCEAFGPIKDKKAANQLLTKIANILQRKHTRKGIKIDKIESDFLIDLFKNTETVKPTGLRKQLFQFQNLFNKSKRNFLKSKIEVANTVCEASEVNQSLQSLLSYRGVLVMNHSIGGGCDAYFIYEKHVIGSKTYPDLNVADFEATDSHKIFEDDFRSSLDSFNKNPPSKDWNYREISSIIWWLNSPRHKTYFKEFSQG